MTHSITHSGYDRTPEISNHPCPYFFMLSTSKTPHFTLGSPHHSPSSLRESPHPWEQSLRLVQQRQTKLRETQGALSADELAQLSGLDAITALLEGRAPVLAMGRTMNFHLIEVKPAEVTFQGTPGENTLNTLGMVHAGWYATLLESALSGAVHTLLSRGQWFTTQNLNVHLVRGLPAHGAPLRAKGSALHLESHSASAHAELIDIEGALYAHASASFKIHSVTKDSN